MTHGRLSKTRISLLTFIVGFVLTIIAVQFPAVKQLVAKLGSTGMFGAFIGGILYAFSFTSSLATALYLNVPGQWPALLIAIVGGIGSAIYDLTIFSLVKQQANHGFFQMVRQSITHQRLIPRWLSLVIGIVILGSPLPDELAAGFFGFMNLSIKKFVALSFAANALGLYCIALLR
jgi:cellobiose-specific phosphotransferase system component IIC